MGLVIHPFLYFWWFLPFLKPGWVQLLVFFVTWMQYIPRTELHIWHFSAASVAAKPTTHLHFLAVVGIQAMNRACRWPMFWQLFGFDALFGLGLTFRWLDFRD